MTLTRKIGADIRADLLAGMSVKSVADKYGCSQATVSYHRGKVNLPKHPDRPVYDWSAIRQAVIDRDLCMVDICREFGPVKQSVQKAIARGDLPKLRDGHPEAAAIETVATIDSAYNRGTLKRRLLASGDLRNHCYNPKCPLHGQDDPVWAGAPLVLHLDHINGVANDHRLENLQMLCANCHGQTHSFAGRNKKYKAA